MMGNMKFTLLLTLSIPLDACAPGVQEGQSYALIVADFPRTGVKAKVGYTDSDQFVILGHQWKPVKALT